MSTGTRAGRNPVESKKVIGEEGSCRHPAWRVFAWIAADGALCAGCCDCGAVLAGEAKPLTGNKEE